MADKEQRWAIEAIRLGRRLALHQTLRQPQSRQMNKPTATKFFQVMHGMPHWAASIAADEYERIWRQRAGLPLPNPAKKYTWMLWEFFDAADAEAFERELRTLSVQTRRSNARVWFPRGTSTRALETALSNANVSPFAVHGPDEPPMLNPDSRTKMKRRRFANPVSAWPNYEYKIVRVNRATT